MPNSDRDRVQIGRKLRRSLEFIRNRVPASMTPKQIKRGNWRTYPHPKARSR